jgi:hypothetical protein
MFCFQFRFAPRPFSRRHVTRFRTVKWRAKISWIDPESGQSLQT